MKKLLLLLFPILIFSQNKPQQMDPCEDPLTGEVIEGCLILSDINGRYQEKKFLKRGCTYSGNSESFFNIGLDTILNPFFNEYNISGQIPTNEFEITTDGDISLLEDLQSFLEGCQLSYIQLFPNGPILSTPVTTTLNCSAVCELDSIYFQPFANFIPPFSTAGVTWEVIDANTVYIESADTENDNQFYSNLVGFILEPCDSKYKAIGGNAGFVFPTTSLLDAVYNPSGGGNPPRIVVTFDNNGTNVDFCCLPDGLPDYQTTLNDIGATNTDFSIDVFCFNINLNSESLYVEDSNGDQPCCYPSQVGDLYPLFSIESLPEMIPIQGGTFEMGCTAEQTGCGSNESPVHEVVLPDFKMSRYEVTQDQWSEVMGPLGLCCPISSLSGYVAPYFDNCGTCPMETISWYDAVVFCNRLSELEGKTPAYYSDAGYNDIYGKSGSTWSLPNSGDIYWDQSADGYRLPTEAEWEYAARGGIFATSTVYAGSNNINDVAWYNSNSDNKTHPVGTKMENELGLYDMSGNVSEWVYDWFDGNYYSSSPSSNPTGPLSGPNRVGRGGNWLGTATACRVAFRSINNPDNRFINIGFRLVLSYEEPDTGNTIEIDETFTILELSCFDVDCPLVLDPTLGSEIEPVRPIRPDDIDLPEPPEPPSCISDVFGECDDGNDNTCNDYSLFCICISQNTFPIITSQLPWEPPLGVGPGEPDMTLINGGEFTMGLCIDDTYTPILSSFLDYMLYGISISGLINNIGTVQTQNVTLDDFYMSRFEVTRSQFETITSDINPSSEYPNGEFYNETNEGSNPIFGGPSAAMINVAWPNAITFCNRLSVYHGYEPVYYYDQSYNNIYGFDGSSWKWSDHEEVFWNPNANGYRLPTEAEWEYAARGGNLEINTIFSGSNNIDDVAWCCGNYSDLLGYTGSVNPNAWPSLSVGLKQPNELGLYDMNGNVSEWVWDWLGEYSEIPVDNPMGPLTGEISIENAQKVYRGGSKNSNTWDNNILFRNSSPEGMWHGFKVGIRLVRSAINCNSNSDCDDNNVCNGVETCDPVLGCQPGTPLNCNDGDPCTVDGCHVITGCYSF